MLVRIPRATAARAGNGRLAPQESQMGKWLGIGIGIGAGIGVAMGNIGAGVAIGVAIGVALGAAEKRKTKDTQ